MTSTKDTRTREQREADRKARQIGKLPRPEALHDFQYPYEKTILSDYMFQYPVYENELDTPSLFNLAPPPDFFLYWNSKDFERTAYPPVPEQDHRLLIPSAKNEAWTEHSVRVRKYLRKHEISPNFVPVIRANVNLSVVFPGRYLVRAVLDEETGQLPPPPPPESTLTRQNFPFTAHCGNFIELCELQQPPSIFFVEENREGAVDPPSFYTLVIVSPDYPYRVPGYVNRHRPEDGFFLHYMIANLPGGNEGGAIARCPRHDRVLNAADLRKEGEVVIPYVPPLPTEDAGTTRHLCLLYKQTRKVRVHPLSAEEEASHFPLAVRSQFRLHDPDARTRRVGVPACLASLRVVEDAIPPEPSAVSFFQTAWDIQVQEFYEKLHLPEPALPFDEEIEALLEFHAQEAGRFRVRARHRPDGSTNMGNDPSFWGQMVPTRVQDGSMQKHWSRRTAMGANGVPIVYPH
ncbi:unnamed protein product [Phytomonas sp. EM1]|nr:unnamed protein product [Phytomonas sp. EM1]|eukprot:CCW62827.1 unnamed protein product [Phytomonas sp. isolate EM1]